MEPNDDIRVNIAERGATLIEYALMAALIAVTAMAGVGYLGQEVARSYDEVGKGLALGYFPDGDEPGAPPPPSPPAPP